MIPIKTRLLKRLLVPAMFVVGTVFLFCFSTVYAQPHSSSPQPQWGNDSLCAKAVREKYLGEMGRNFNALNSKQIDARTFDKQMKDFDLRSYEDYKKCMAGKGISTTVQPVLPPVSEGGDPGPDWWDKVKQAPAPPVVKSQPLPQPMPPPLGAKTILAIDGIGFLIEIFGKDYEILMGGTPFPVIYTGENYLRRSLQSFFTALGVGTNVNPMPWSRVTSDTKMAVAELKAYIIPRGVNSRKETFTIVAHSWAGVLAYVALEELQGSHPDISVDTLVTLGTPVGYLPQINNSTCFEARTKQEGILSSFRNAKQSPRLAAETSARAALCAVDYLGKYKGKKISVTPNVRRWINWYAEGDGFSTWVVATRAGGRQGVENHKADDLRKIDGGLKSYIHNNHKQYFAWNNSDRTKDGENIRANATRVLGELSK